MGEVPEVGDEDKIRRKGPERRSEKRFLDCSGQLVRGRSRGKGVDLLRSERPLAVPLVASGLSTSGGKHRTHRDTRVPQLRVTVGGAVRVAIALEGGDFEGERFEMFVN
jgi:hypothetical protein